MGDVVVFTLARDEERARPLPNECGTVVTFTGMWYERPQDQSMDAAAVIPEKWLDKRRLSGHLSRFLGLRAR